jgi:hypothetical protein
VERFDENGAMYHWKGIKAGDIVSVFIQDGISSYIQLSGKVRVPLESAALHQALQDAETGKAQTQQGSLDTLLDENNRPLTSSEASKIDLEQGEILKLPPTPDMTDGTEYQSDPETHNVRPLSGSSTPTTRRVPPPLPARGLRPTIARNDSSTSHYSDAQEGSGAGSATPPSTSIPSAQIQTGTTSQVPVDGPPGYELEQHQTAYPTEKGAFTDEPQVMQHAHTAPEGLTEGERLEWEQHYADQQLAEQANKLILDHGDKDESLR